MFSIEHVQFIDILASQFTASSFSQDSLHRQSNTATDEPLGPISLPPNFLKSSQTLPQCIPDPSVHSTKLMRRQSAKACLSLDLNIVMITPLAPCDRMQKVRTAVPHIFGFMFGVGLPQLELEQIPCCAPFHSQPCSLFELWERATAAAFKCGHLDLKKRGDRKYVDFWDLEIMYNAGDLDSRLLLIDESLGAACVIIRLLG